MVAGSGTYFKFNVPPNPTAGGVVGRSPNVEEGGGNVPTGREREGRNFNRRDITGNAAVAGIRGSNFLKERVAM